MNIDRILVPTDFSENADQALTYAMELASSCDAEIHLLHVPVVPTYLMADLSYSPGPEVVIKIHEQANLALDARGTRLQEANTRFVCVLREGTVHEAVRAYAEEAGIDLMVVGTHGRTGVAKLLHGSVTERIVKTAATPMIIVPPGAAPKPASIVVAYDFSAPAKRAAEVARELHQRYPGDLHLVHSYLDVWAEYTDRGTVVGEPANRRREALLRGLDEMLTEATDELFPDDERVHRHLVSGDPAEGILEVTNDVKSSLVCAGTTGKSGIERIFLGSVARRLLHDAKVPLLLVHGED